MLTSVVVACRDRPYESLVNNLASIFKEEEEGYQIVLVDWGSVLPIVTGHPASTIQLYRVEASSWILSHAYNFGFSKARGDYVLKLDCDTRLSSAPRPPLNGTFTTGDWRTGGKEHTNGLFYAPLRSLQSVGYYDERIVTYGWDDSDLYLRLQSLTNLSRSYLDLSIIEHEDHPNELRSLTHTDDFQLEWETQKNHMCTRGNLWTERMPRIQYSVSGDGIYREVYRPPLLRFQSCDPSLAQAIVFKKVFRGCKRCMDEYWHLYKAHGNASLAFKELVGNDLASRCVSTWKTFGETSEACKQARFVVEKRRSEL